MTRPMYRSQPDRSRHLRKLRKAACPAELRHMVSAMSAVGREAEIMCSIRAFPVETLADIPGVRSEIVAAVALGGSCSAG
jgi:hypothetical protein